MASEWIECQLADACSSIDYGLTASASKIPSAARFLRITDIEGGIVEWETVPYIQAEPDIIEKYKLNHGDVVIARTGASTGRSAYIKHPPSAVFASYLVRLKARHGYDSRFIYYYLNSSLFWNFIRGVLGDKSAQPNASASTMTKAPFCAPKDIEEQRAVAGIFGLFDDRITELRQSNQSLEAIARAIFKSWFVDFDPVRAKAEGREPEGMDAATAALFPNEFQQSELGLIPAGWTAGRLGDVCEIARSVVQKGDMHAEDNYVGLEHIPRGSWALADWGTAEDLQSGKSRFVRGDILFGKLRPYFHKVCIAPVDGVCSTDILVIRPEPIWTPFVLCHASSRALIDYATRLSNGAKMPRTKWQDLDSYAIAVPAKQIAEVFADIVRPLMDKVIESVHEAKTLTELRDTLLPRLISGKLRVPEAEKLVEAVI